jgi:hypothetical protein
MDPSKPQDATSKMDMRLSSTRKGHIRKDHRVWLCLRLIDSIIFAKYKIVNYSLSFWLFSFKVRFDGSVLCVEVSHIDDEILQDEHMAQRGDD